MVISNLTNIFNLIKLIFIYQYHKLISIIWNNCTITMLYTYKYYIKLVLYFMYILIVTIINDCTIIYTYVYIIKFVYINI